MAVADELRAAHGAELNARLVEEAAELYERRGLFANVTECGGREMTQPSHCWRGSTGRWRLPCRAGAAARPRPRT